MKRQLGFVVFGVTFLFAVSVFGQSTETRREVSIGLGGGYGQAWYRGTVDASVNFDGTHYTLEEFVELAERAGVDDAEMPETDIDAKERVGRYPAFELQVATSDHGRWELVLPLINMIVDFSDGIYGFEFDTLGSYTWGSGTVRGVLSTGMNFKFGYQEYEEEGFFNEILGVRVAGVLRSGPEFDFGAVRLRTMLRFLAGYEMAMASTYGDIGPRNGAVRMEVDSTAHSFVFGLMGEIALLFDL